MIKVASMTGLGPSDARVKINPIRIGLLDELDFPGTVPFLEPLLSLNRRLDIRVLFEVD
jgi:hypothetical protein